MRNVPIASRSVLISNRPVSTRHWNEGKAADFQSISKDGSDNGDAPRDTRYGIVLMALWRIAWARRSFKVGRFGEPDV